MKEEKGYRNQPRSFYCLSWRYGKFQWFGLFVSSKQSLKNDCSLVIGQKVWEELKTVPEKTCLYLLQCTSDLFSSISKMEAYFMQQ